MLGIKDHYNEHLLNRVPNNIITRWIIGYLNRKMKLANSGYYLRIRYRCPKNGTYGWGGTVTRDNSKAFAIYLRVR